jgi:hypothetical protein
MNIDWREAFNYIVKADGVKDLINIVYWDGTTPNPIEPYNDITICTTCMNRLEDLQQTIIKNIQDNIDYKGNKEFLILDYGSTTKDLENWVKDNLGEYIKQGVVTFYRTDEPKSYSMAHSRNICFKLAKYNVVNSVDADNLVNKGFLEKINLLAHQQPEKAAFVKGRKMLRGRLGFYKSEFIDLLGGYNEELTGYGGEDHDLLYRACGLGFRAMWFGGDFYTGIQSRKHQVTNFDNKLWRYTEKRNKIVSFYNIYYKMYKANLGKEWGKATVVKNFGEEVIKL